VEVTADKVYEALHLARAAVHYISTPESEMNDEQSSALHKFRNLSLLRFGWRDGSKGVTTYRVREVLELNSRMFFFGALKTDFQWRDLPPGRLAQCHENSLIEVDPTNLGWETDTIDAQGGRLRRLAHCCMKPRTPSFTNSRAKLIRRTQSMS
jgi:hypothetical protein